ncbi:ARSB [Mytilus coruscus]|uniref:ARSB n=1 Tax=Mytilus coruscus TaxID=42192 RepID=A0A6J8E7K7_MYTCO|nr:ARSB [Mytilus coruscus]
MIVYKKDIFAVLVCYQLYYAEGYCKGKTNRRPHIVLVVSDDQGWNDVSWHNPEVLTPNMDNLAKQGVRLENHYVHPQCSPSRGAILTGKYSHRLGLQFGAIIPNEAKFLPESATLLPEKLKEMGYSTHMTGKWHLGDCNKNFLPTTRGFDSFTGLLRGAEDYFTRQLCIDILSVVLYSDISSFILYSDISSVVQYSDIHAFVQYCDIHAFVLFSDILSIVLYSDISSIVLYSDISSVVQYSDIPSIVLYKHISPIVLYSDISSFVLYSDISSIVLYSDISSIVLYSDIY